MKRYLWVTRKESIGPVSTRLKIGSVYVGGYSISVSERGKHTSKFYLTGETASYDSEEECRVFLINCMVEWLEKANLTHKEN